MQSSAPQPVFTPPLKKNIYASLSPINGALAFLGNCLNLFAAIIPGLPIVCGVISGLFSLGALITGLVGLTQINRSQGTQKGRGWAVTGIALGALGLLAACLIPLLATSLWAALGLELGDLLLVPVE
jgi:hypothetical protein